MQDPLILICSSIHLRIHPKRREAVLEWSGFFKVIIRRTHNRVTVLPSLEMVLVYLNPLWLDETLEMRETGILADTGFLSVMTPSFLTNGSNSIVREQGRFKKGHMKTALL